MLCAGFEDSPSELIPKNFFIKCIDTDGLWKLKSFSSYFLFFFKLDLFDRWIYRGNFIRNSEREFKSQRYLPPELYACVLRCVQLFVTQWLWAIRLLCPWNFSGKNTGLDCHFLLQEDLPDPGIKSMSVSLTVAGRFFTDEPLGKPFMNEITNKKTWAYSKAFRRTWQSLGSFRTMVFCMVPIKECCL